jgi:hypothetical protein
MSDLGVFSRATWTPGLVEITGEYRVAGARVRRKARLRAGTLSSG